MFPALFGFLGIRKHQFIYFPPKLRMLTLLETHTCYYVYGAEDLNTANLAEKKNENVGSMARGRGEPGSELGLASACE